MLVFVLASMIGYTMITEFLEVEPQDKGLVYYHTGYGQQTFQHKESIEPLSEYRFNNVVRQAYDYSCGSAALTTLLDFYLGRNFQERQVMEGLLQFGDTEKIVERRGFSLLDMKRLVTALGHPSGGFRAEQEDLIKLDHPAIAPIEYAGFKHFVVIRGVKDGHVYVADPSVGNISFTLSRFMQVWDRNVLFIVFPNGHKPVGGLEIRDEDMRVIDERTFTKLAFREFKDVFPVDHMGEPRVIANELARSKNNAYWVDTEVEGNDELDSELIIPGADGYDPTRVNTVSGESPVRKTIRFKRK
ncbi:C39 family peptidase [Bermanella marisrubri]|uniref:Predicted double-glycine peptidase n=1 Tax=Bermanella marisrubri TaxID=207949 RepID=Q1MXZ2_9GAMM|nr:C39 family peptidase [Bermanella marisrubri]EAT10837.1 predicted double-glycine peptidase [Oceanobacter sp. RED65] [Bermanella marisrubri]QIZ84219.1 C39 family peptidase [Bermanella marisrubri]